MSISRCLLTLSFAIAFCTSTTSAQTTDTVSLTQRVEQLERRIAELEQRVQAFETSPQRQRSVESGTATGNWEQVANWRHLQRGMSKDEVRRLLGEPDRVDVFDFTVWTYGDYAKVTFDPDSQRVSGWSEPRSSRD